jgi:SAM-dependent methyltransferase
MTYAKELPSRACPVCGTGSARAAIFCQRHIDETQLSRASYASRKIPEYMNHQLVICPVCDLVYADRPPPAAQLAQDYAEASYDTAEEAGFAANAYHQALMPALSRLKPRRAVLEIGCGTGVFLETLGADGFAARIGIEPSAAARDAAPAHIRPLIRQDIFRPEDFEPGSFSMICCFQTLEHVPDPRALTDAAFRLLAPGGLLAFAAHDRDAWINRALGRRSPIIDIEHLQLFNRQSLTKMLTQAGFSDVTIGSFKNLYPLKYWLRLAPVPFKAAIIAALTKSGLGSLPVAINVGNLLSVAFKGAVS